MARLTVFLAFLLVSVPVMAQPEPDPGIIGDTLRPIQEQIVGTVLPPTENATGDDLHTEEFHIKADLRVTNIEYQIVPIMFGGGKIQGDLRGILSLDFYAVSTERLDDAIRAFAGNDNVSLNDTFGVPTGRIALTAEEVRLVGAGVVLETFQAQQEGLATSYVLNMVPGLRILALETQWSNTQPLADYTALLSDPTAFEPGIPSLREPPIHLDVIVDLQYLDRLSLYDIMQGVITSDKNETAAAVLKDEIRSEQELPFLQRNAFQVLGIGQLLNLDLQPGWSLDVSLTVPKGFTVESVTDELSRSPARTSARYYLDGSERQEANSDAGIVTVSNRFLVTTSLLLAVLLVGGIFRAITELSAVGHMRRKQAKRRK